MQLPVLAVLEYRLSVVVAAPEAIISLASIVVVPTPSLDEVVIAPAAVVVAFLLPNTEIPEAYSVVVVAFVLVAFTVTKLVMVLVALLTKIPPAKVERPVASKVLVVLMAVPIVVAA